VSRFTSVGLTAQLSEPILDSDLSTAEISASYVKWVEQGGARVAVIPFDATVDHLKDLFQSVNGLLLTGGDNTLAPETQYFQTASHLWELAKEANLKGDYFPVWGTCQGFQLMCILAAEDQSVLLHDKYDSWNIAMPLTLTENANASRLLSGAPSVVISALTEQSSTQNLHHNGVLPETFASSKKLNDVFVLLSVNVDRKGKSFGSTIEGREFPFYATQWHPERNQFEWGVEETLCKTSDAIQSMQYLSDFFVLESRKNFHYCLSSCQSALIYNFQPTYTGQDTSDNTPDQQVYLFKNTTLSKYQY